MKDISEKIKGGWRRLNRNNRGAMWIWSTVFLGIILFAIIYIPLDDAIEHKLYNMAISDTSLDADDATVNTLKVIWNFMPFFTMGGLFYWGWSQAQKEDSRY